MSVFALFLVSKETRFLKKRQVISPCLEFFPDQVQEK